MGNKQSLGQNYRGRCLSILWKKTVHNVNLKSHKITTLDGKA